MKGQFHGEQSERECPARILEWLGIEYYNEKNYEAAAKYLGALARSTTSNQTSCFIGETRRQN
jgi:hypothetical protein